MLEGALLPYPGWRPSCRRRARRRTPPYTAVLEPGDAIMFDEMTLHRTVAPWTLPYREVAVTWFFAPAEVP